jgi:hypothetical protein
MVKHYYDGHELRSYSIEAVISTRHSLLGFLLAGLLFLFLSEIHLSYWIQLPALAIPFGMLVFFQLEHKDRRNERERPELLLDTSYIPVLQKASDIYRQSNTGETIKL